MLSAHNFLGGCIKYYHRKENVVIILGIVIHTLMLVNWLFKGIKLTHFSQTSIAEVSNENINDFNKIHEFLNTFSVSY